MPDLISRDEASQQALKDVFFPGNKLSSLTHQFLKVFLQLQQAGHVCLDLNYFVHHHCPLSEQDASFSNLLDELSRQSSIGQAGDYQPFILDLNRLYFYRYWRDELIITDFIQKRKQTRFLPVSEDATERFKLLFPDLNKQANQAANGQAVATAVAMAHGFCVISGGPGTGKTTVIIRLLMMLLSEKPDLKIALAAPTGKAAERMSQAIQSGLNQVPDQFDEYHSYLPKSAQTLHSLLGAGKHGFKHNKNQPIACDCLILDEASMIDMHLMARVMDALPSHARLILLGDPNQLASVEAGSVLSDLLGPVSQASNYSQTQLDWLHELGLRLEHADSHEQDDLDHVALLHKSHRFDDKRGIGQLAKAIQRAEYVAVEQAFRTWPDELTQYKANDPEFDAVSWAVNRYQMIRQQASPQDALNTFELTQVLCATRKGAYGVEKWNDQIHQSLMSKVPFSDQHPQHGMPIIIRQNNRASGLFNGDIGVLWLGNEGLTAWFKQSAEHWLQIAPHQLPRWDPAWALTVHQSQGSEWDEVMLVLPDNHQDLLSQSLLYTAVTRSKNKFILLADSEIIQNTIQTKVHRQSGLKSRLFHI